MTQILHTNLICNVNSHLHLMNTNDPLSPQRMHVVVKTLHRGSFSLPDKQRHTKTFVNLSLSVSI